MENIANCCKKVNACDAVCLLNNVLIDLVSGGFVTNYKVGGESFSFAKPSLSEVRSLLEFFKGECNESKGIPKRRRAKVCLVFGEHTCGSCGTSNSNCRC